MRLLKFFAIIANTSSHQQEQGMSGCSNKCSMSKCQGLAIALE